MKKIFYYISAAVLTFGLASCTKEVVIPNEPATHEVKGQMTIVADIESGLSTKVSLDGNDTEGYQVLWSEGDQIKFNVKNGDIQETITYTLSKGAGTTSGEFTGPVLPDGEYTAGYGDNLSMANGGNLYGTQNYSSSKNASCAPMMASVTVAGGVASIAKFKNICGLLRLELKGDGMVKEIKVITDKAQGGLIALDEEGAAYIRIYSEMKEVTLDCSESEVTLSSEAKPFYISMPKNDYTGLTIEVSDFSGHTCTKTMKAGKTLNIARAQITPASFTVTGLTDEIPLTWDSPVGACGILDGRECVVIDLGGSVGKVAIATKNVGAETETDYGDYFNWLNVSLAQNDKSWGNGWHLPSTEETTAFAEYVNSAPKYAPGYFLVVKITDNSTLSFPYGGYYEDYSKEVIFKDVTAEFITSSVVNLNPTSTFQCKEIILMEDGCSLPNVEGCSFNVRPFHYLPITKNTPAGMPGILGDREAMVVELNMNGTKKKVVVALKNEGATSEHTYIERNGTKYHDCFGSYYTYAQTEALCTDGWYLPSIDEIKGLWDNPDYEITQPIDGLESNVYWHEDEYDQDARYARKIKVADRGVLTFPAGGFGNVPDGRGRQGYFWTSTVDASNNKRQYAYGMEKSARKYSVWFKSEECSVRLFHDIPR